MWWWNVKNMKWNGHGLILIAYQHLHERTEENHEKHISLSPAEIQTTYFQNYSELHDYCIDLLSGRFIPNYLFWIKQYLSCCSL
jgi:hypothetical protein